MADLNPFPLSELALSSFVGNLALASPHDFDRLIADVDVVYHFAWNTIPALANVEPLNDLIDNLTVTIRLLDALKRRGSGKLIFASSGGTVYGILNQVPVPETHPLEPTTAYGVSKVAAEKYLQLYRYLHGVDVRVMRISNPFGAGQNPERPQGAVGRFVHNALHKRTVQMWGDGTVIRDFIYIRDVVNAALLLAEAELPLNGPLPVYNIGSGTGSSLNEVVSLIEMITGNPLRLERQPGRAFDVPVSILCVKKAAKDLGWAPTTDLADGIMRMIADLKNDGDRLFSS